jgi:hypothetical protein
MSFIFLVAAGNYAKPFVYFPVFFLGQPDALASRVLGLEQIRQPCGDGILEFVVQKRAWDKICIPAAVNIADLDQLYR